MNHNIHIWIVPITQSDTFIEEEIKILSREEFSRAERFRFKQDRRRFIASRGMLRTILSWYIDLPPKNIEINYEIYGKPYLATDINERGIQFNLAHSNQLAIYAISSGLEIGIDLEYVRTISDIDGIASTFFSAFEREMICSLPESEKLEGFYKYWTRKEAYLKALGAGITGELQFDLSFNSDESSFVYYENNLKNSNYWTIRSFKPFRRYWAALVVEGKDCSPSIKIISSSKNIYKC